MSTIDVRRANERFHTAIDWLDSWHSFSFSEHYDPKNTHFGLLRVLNDDVVAPGGAFGTHPHRDMEIVTWVLDGALEHRDSEGNVGVITRDIAQRMSAGTGIRHSEANASKTESVHLLQMWVPPDAFGDPPGYEQRDVSNDIETNALFPLASGAEHVTSAIHINQDDATLWIGRLTSGATVTMPASPFVHVFVARGAATLDGAGELATGDAVRLTDAGQLELTATADDTEVVVWEMNGDLAT
jgi:redox-sensitive bicupin YhaK (pirin superfamily)